MDSGLLGLLCILVILSLSEAFDNFSIGKLISISREVRKKETAVVKLERQNADLISQMISISSNNKQTQSHTNVYGDYHTSPSVRKATEDEVEDSGVADDTPINPDASPQIPPPARRPRVNLRVAENIAFEKYVEQRKVSRDAVVREAKLVSQFDGNDPISNYQPIFDAFIRGAHEHVFVEMLPRRMASPLYRDRLYMMLSKINHYRAARRIDAHLELVLTNIPDDEGYRYPLEKFMEFFSPALASGLMRTVNVEFTKEEITKIMGS